MFAASGSVLDCPELRLTTSDKGSLLVKLVEVVSARDLTNKYHRNPTAAAMPEYKYTGPIDCAVDIDTDKISGKTAVVTGGKYKT